MNLRAALPALLAAALFGISTPLAKLLLGGMPPMLLAGLLYLGSGLGLAILVALRHATAPEGESAPLLAIPKQDRPWLLGAIVAGGICGPALLMAGLARSSAASASLLLTLEGVFTALLAWFVFKENADRRVVAGMAAIVADDCMRLTF